MFEDTDDMVNFYEREFYVLSNFSSFKVRMNGIWFDTAEHAYHWSRFNLDSPRNKILETTSAHDAYTQAQKLKAFQVSNWDKIKIPTMLNILRLKALQHEYVLRKLLETGDRKLIECSWRDDFWGWGPNQDGQNQLGKLWMQVREELKNPVLMEYIKVTNSVWLKSN